MIRTYVYSSFVFLLAALLCGCSLDLNLTQHPSLLPNSPDTENPIQSFDGKLCFEGGAIRTVLEADGIRYYGGDFTKAGPCQSGVTNLSSDPRGQAVSLPVSLKEAHALVQDSAGRFYVAMTVANSGEMHIKRFTNDWALDNSFVAPAFYYHPSLLEQKRQIAWLHIKNDKLILAGPLYYTQPSEEEEEEGGVPMAMEDGRNVAILNLENGSLLPASIVADGLDLLSVDDVIVAGSRVVLVGTKDGTERIVVDLDYVNQTVFVEPTGFDSPASLLVDGAGQPLAYHMGSESSELYTINSGVLIPRAFDISACGVLGSPNVKAYGNMLYLLALVEFENNLVNICSYDLSTNQVTRVMPWDTDRIPPSQIVWAANEERIALAVGSQFLELKRSDLTETYYQSVLSSETLAAVSGGFFALGAAGNGVAGSGAHSGLYAESMSTRQEVEISTVLSLDGESDGPNDTVSIRGLAVHGNKLYAGGFFGKVNGVQQQGLVVLDIKDEFKSLALPVAVSGNVSGLSLYNNKLYMVGNNLVVGEDAEDGGAGDIEPMSVSSASKLVAVDLNTGLLDSGLSNEVVVDIGNDDIYTLYVNQSGIYIGGYFVISHEGSEYWDFAVLDHQGTLIGTPLPDDPGDYESVSGVVESGGKIYFSVWDSGSDKASYAELKPDMTFETKLLSSQAGTKAVGLFKYNGNLHGVVTTQGSDAAVIREVMQDGTVVESEKLSVSEAEAGGGPS
ncbi:hypothetical protein ACNH6C_16745 [Bdellovibrio bacteriovorus]|uniref:hypothetical protein n=1 Tax=Bdellovibrio bacteriovorus TaxID=959 RepID=UPI003A806917